MPRPLVAALAVLALGGCGARAPAPASSVAPLTLQESVGQRIIYSLPATTIPASLAARIRSGEAAGVVLYARNISSRGQLRGLTSRLQALAARGPAALRHRPLLVMLDQEGGLVKRLAGAPRHSAQQLGAIGSVALARREGLATARNLRGVGVNVDLAPVLDVGRPGSNVATLHRSFGSTPGRVIRLAGAFATGLSAGGVVACAKHFPGLGRARTDEDLSVNSIDAPLASLRAVDEAPFRALARRLPMVMVSSGRYPALSALPAMLSRRISTGELRDRAGFAGVSVSDDPETPALAGIPPDRKAVEAADAGNDVLVYAQSIPAGEQGAAAIEHAVRAGRITARAQAAAVARVLALRSSLR